MFGANALIPTKITPSGELRAGPFCRPDSLPAFWSKQLHHADAFPPGNYSGAVPKSSMNTGTNGRDGVGIESDIPQPRPFLIRAKNSDSVFEWAKCQNFLVWHLPD